jgi:anti-sigma regulatory factor (Ser/Thr protein kinase)
MSVRIPGGEEAPLRARRWVRSQLDGQLGESGADDLALIVSELVTTSVVHANVGPHETVGLECAVLPGRLRVTVTDPGSHLEPRPLSTDDHAAGGYGLTIVEALSSAWGVLGSAQGTMSVWCEVPFDLSSLPAIDRTAAA